ncbi:hypothetical protein ES703_107043 [subsurface metagenome]
MQGNIRLCQKQENKIHKIGILIIFNVFSLLAANYALLSFFRIGKPRLKAIFSAQSPYSSHPRLQPYQGQHPPPTQVAQQELLIAAKERGEYFLRQDAIFRVW